MDKFLNIHISENFLMILTNFLLYNAVYKLVVKFASTLFTMVSLL